MNPVSDPQISNKRPLENTTLNTIRPTKKRGFIPPRPKVASPPKEESDNASKSSIIKPMITNTKTIVKTPIKSSSPKEEEDETIYFTVLYCKKGPKKQKSYMDGVLAVKKSLFTLYDSHGKQIRKGFEMIKKDSLFIGNLIDVGLWTVELSANLKESNFTSGRVFLGTVPTSDILYSIPLILRKKGDNTPVNKTPSILKPVALVAPPSDAFILSPEVNTPLVKLPAIYIDQFLSKKMKPHQKEGCKFLYQCLYGLRGFAGNGAILADEMGLGKTLTSISAIWTCVNSTPDPRCACSQYKNAVVVCPSSLVDNWRQEFNKWVGSERIYVICINVKGKEAKTKIDHYCSIYNKRKCVLIISYEMYRKYDAEICAIPVNLIVCDEGHRLKSGTSNLTVDALAGIKTRRRIILTGTPIQNDLEELYSLANYVNPGIFGELNTFKQLFCKPIEQGRREDSSQQEKTLAAMRSQELSRITDQFIIRRTTASSLKSALPPKVTHYIFTKLSSLQESLYKGIIDLQKKSETLGYIHLLKLVCCHPAICYNAIKQKTEYASLLASYPDNYQEKDLRIEESPKMMYIAALINTILNTTKELILVLSNYTQVLDYVQTLLRSSLCSHAFIRLDGTTDIQKRQEMVNNFNTQNVKARVFLLSARAGGVGLNITGASRVIMLEPAWNPAIDLQSIARSWRLGQTKTVYVYRTFCSGGIEEVVLQRQLFKKDIADLAVDHASINNSTFNRDELRQIFNLQPVKCHTYELLKRNNKEISWINYTGLSSITEDTLIQQALQPYDKEVNFIHTEVLDPNRYEQTDNNESNTQSTTTNTNNTNTNNNNTMSSSKLDSSSIPSSSSSLSTIPKSIDLDLGSDEENLCISSLLSTDTSSLSSTKDSDSISNKNTSMSIVTSVNTSEKSTIHHEDNIDIDIDINEDINIDTDDNMPISLGSQEIVEEDDKDVSSVHEEEEEEINNSKQSKKSKQIIIQEFSDDDDDDDIFTLS
ncbi:hypothetical protein WA158_005694 [Blastocystis sp. Blastoise]